MVRTVIIADVKTLERLSVAGALSVVSCLVADIKVLDWLPLSPSQKSICERHHIGSVSLTDSEVKEAFRLYQRTGAHKVGLAQYGALVFAKYNGAFFASCDELTLNMGRDVGLLTPESADTLLNLFPTLAIYGVYNPISSAI